MKLLRIALAIFFLASTTLSVVTSAHAACGDAGASDHAFSGHEHDDSAASHHHGNDAGSDDGGAPDDTSRTAGTNCHSSAGCPGCVSVTAPALPSPTAMPIAFRPSAENGQSAEPDTQLRPPKTA